jgi:signal transduction histidine kinase
LSLRSSSGGHGSGGDVRESTKTEPAVSSDQLKRVAAAPVNPTPRQLLRDNTLFRGLPAAALEDLLDEIPLYPASAGDVIVPEGVPPNADEAADIYLVLSGTVKITRLLPGDREHAVTQLGAGAFFGEMAVFAPGPRSARVVAGEPTLLARVDRDLLDRILAIDPLTVVKTITRVLAERLREANDTIVATHLRQEKLAAIGSIAGQIAHDLKSPLNAVAGVADLLTDPAAQLPPHRQAQILRRAVQSVIGLVDDILSFAADRPRRPYRPVTVDELIRNVEDFGLTALARNGRIEIKRRVEPVPDFIGDAVALERMLLNLIKNAGEAMPSGGTLTFQVAKAGESVEFVVEDTGTGIQEEIRGRLFQSFATFGKTGGTGLGLAMVKKTVDAHSGSIVVESAPGVGTKFVVQIPLRSS